MYERTNVPMPPAQTKRRKKAFRLSGDFLVRYFHDADVTGHVVRHENARR